LSSRTNPESDSYLLCYSGPASSDDGKLLCSHGSFITFEQVILLWEVFALLYCSHTLVNNSRSKASPACRNGHRLILILDSCHSGHWAVKAQQRCLSNVVVQSSCASDQKSVGGIFIKAFVSFQNSGGKERPSPAQLHSRAPLVYVPWSAGIEPVIYKEPRGSAGATVPYMHLLSAPDGLLHPKFPLSKHESWNLVSPCSACAQ
jgi:hypothetical protein